jgi:exosortase/archaeosortase family protein
MKSLQTAYERCNVFIHRHKLGALVDVLIFALITIVFHMLWWDFYGWITQFTIITSTADRLARAVYLSSHWFNKNILMLNMTTSEPNTMWFSNGSHVTIDEGCSGLKQFYQIAVLFILFPGPWKHKLWFIPAGSIVMFFVNVFRIVVLSLVALHWPQYWDFIHEWVLRTFFYVVIFALWVVWVEKFRRRKQIIV